MPRLAVLSTLLALLLAAPAAADLGGRKHSVDDRIAGLRDRIAEAQARERALGGEIATATARIRALEARVGDVSTALATLEDDLALHRTRLAGVQALFDLQTRRLRLLRAQYRTALDRLDGRLVAIYKSNDPTVVDVILESRNIGDLLDQVDYLSSIARQDEHVARQFARARADAAVARARTSRARAAVAAETRVIAYRAQQQAELRASLVASRDASGRAQAGRERELATLHDNEQEWTAEADALRGVSAQLAAQIQSAQASPPPAAPGGSDGGAPAAPASSGMVWPVSGPITSPFGLRWGKLHPGIDIGVGTGTPIRAAASGRVILAAYSGGYGNLVVIDHGNGIATAYAHQSRIAVSVGAQVAQGEVVGYVGSTGFSTGPHLHFEVRVNGSPVDPMGYL